MPYSFPPSFPIIHSKTLHLTLVIEPVVGSQHLCIDDLLPLSRLNHGNRFQRVTEET